MDFQLMIASGKAISKTTYGHVTCQGTPFDPVTNLVLGDAVFPDQLLKVSARNCNNHGMGKTRARGLWFDTTFAGDRTQHIILRLRAEKRRDNSCYANSAILLYVCQTAPTVQVTTVLPESADVTSGTVSVFYGPAFVVTPQQANELARGAISNTYVKNYCDPQEVLEDFAVQTFSSRSPYLDGNSPANEMVRKAMKPKRRILI